MATKDKHYLGRWLPMGIFVPIEPYIRSLIKEGFVRNPEKFSFP